MKPNELRIGNYVNWINTQEPNSLYLIEEIRELNYHDCFVPIPLNEEWLLKFRFEKEYGAFKLKGLKCWFTKYTSEPNLYSANIGNIKISTLKYVHQLQNLYFALTGEELQIKK